MNLLRTIFTLKPPIKLPTQPLTRQPMSAAIYLDANATTSVLPSALAAAQRVMAEDFGNPSSSHSHGILAKTILEQTRSLAIDLLDAGQGDIVFNSGATESIQTAVLSALCDIRARRQQGLATGRLLVYGATEHKAVPQSLAHWNAILGLDLELRALPVNAQGLHDLQLLAQWLPETAMLATMAANNETGVVSDLAGIENLLNQASQTATSPTFSASTTSSAPAASVLWLVDGVQALGKIKLQLAQSRIDYAAFSGHKLYAPKGIGMLYVRKGAPYTALMAGGGQENAMRSGTENMAGIAALGAVMQALREGGTFASHGTLKRHIGNLAQALRHAFPAIVFNAPLDACLPTTLNFSVPGFSSKIILDVFDAAGLRVSAGSACSAAKAAPSYVLEAMGLPLWQTESAVRLSIGALVTDAAIDAACQAIVRCGQALHQASAQPQAPAPANWEGVMPTPQSPARLTLHWHDLAGFLQQHPNAHLVDVREVPEFQVSGPLHSGQHIAHNLPLGACSAKQFETLFAAKEPVVFFCRSGNRSLKAAQWLSGLGHPHVQHLHGGLALRFV
jgi:cysteine desulfurase